MQEFAESAFSEQDVIDILDTPTIQKLMEEFYQVTHIGIAILDLKGNVLVATGWQDICTQYHRVHPQTVLNCRESDLYLAQNMKDGEYVLYKCKNHMWDIVTPVSVGGHHFANLYLGQFFFEDEEIDEALFAAQAERYGFDRQAYLEALRRVPVWTRETVQHVMSFYTQLAHLVARLSYSRLQLVNALEEQKRVQQALQESEEKYRRIVETANEGIWAMDGAYRTTFVNAEMARMLGYAPEEMIGHRVDSFMFQEDLAEHNEKMKARQNGLSSCYERRFKRKDGTECWCLVSATALTDNEEQFAGSFAMLTDITGRKQMEKNLTTALAEKEILLKEVHHRVKNNLSVVIGLLSLEADTISEPHLKEAFIDIQQRVRVIALTHEMLYRSSNLTHIDAGEYLRSLIDRLAASLNINPLIEREVLTDNISLSIDQALPLGMIVNELVTNTIKYAFPSGQSGLISVALKQENAKCTLVVMDNGIGLPPGMNWEQTESLGLQLVKLLSNQLGGKIVIQSSGGVTASLTFPIQ